MLNLTIPYSRVFTQKYGSEEQIINNIEKAVRVRLERLKNVKIDDVIVLLYRSWGLHRSIFD